MTTTQTTLNLGNAQSARRLASILIAAAAAAAIVIVLAGSFGASGPAARSTPHSSAADVPAIHFYGTGAAPMVPKPATASEPQRSIAYPRGNGFYGAWRLRP